jgi:signal transduction histidine kinase
VGVAVENARLYDQAERSAAIAERSRLARELHDSVTQSLYSVNLYAEAAARLLLAGDNTTAASHLRELRDTAQEALREMRLLIFELRAPALEKSGLAAAIQARLDAVEGRGGVQAELQVEGEESLPFAIQEELYHAVQEALNNALRHAKAQRVQVRLQFQDAATRVEICDDGLGFDPTVAGEGGGFGLRGMRERAQRIGGSLQIESAPGKGTKVSILVPTKREG